MVSKSNFKPYLSNPSRIFKIEAMKAVLWLIKLVYFILTHTVYKYVCIVSTRSLAGGCQKWGAVNCSVMD